MYAIRSYYASVLEAFRDTHPDHELNREATKQIAFVRREEGNLSRAAEEYERVARESDDPELRREAMLVITSYSIHYTKLYEDLARDLRPARCVAPRTRFNHGRCDPQRRICISS